MDEDFDIIVIGAGVAGVSVAAALARGARVAVVEAEAQPGYHATGRSAAILAQNYGSRLIRTLTADSLLFFTDPPDGFARSPLLRPRGLIRFARPDQVDRLRTAYDDMSRDTPLAWITGEALEARVPLLRAGHVAAGFENPDAADIDVNELMQGWQRQLRAAGGRMMTGNQVVALTRRRGRWTVETTVAQLSARLVVNAAGAWADHIADLARAARIGLMPLRRSALTFDAPADLDLASLPMMVDADEAFYLKPEAGRLLASPADETLSAPCDARPEELDLALAIDRVQTTFRVDVRRIRSSWAGLRSFVADRAPAAGFDTGVPEFFWLAGQGGYGVQTAPALARYAASRILGRTGADRYTIPGVTDDVMSPTRVQTHQKTKKGENA